MAKVRTRCMYCNRWLSPEERKVHACWSWTEDGRLDKMSQL